MIHNLPILPLLSSNPTEKEIEFYKECMKDRLEAMNAHVKTTTIMVTVFTYGTIGLLVFLMACVIKSML